MHIEPPSHILEYRALGFIKGLFLPQSHDDDSECSNSLYQGYLKDQHDNQIPAHIINIPLLKHLEKNPLILEESQLWIVFVKTSPTFQVQIKHFRNDIEHPSQDIFSIRGNIQSINAEESVFEVLIKQNKDSTNKKFKPFTLTIHGQVSEELGIGDFVDISAIHQGLKIFASDIQLIRKSKTINNNKKRFSKFQKPKIRDMRRYNSDY